VLILALMGALILALPVLLSGGQIAMPQPAYLPRNLMGAKAVTAFSSDKPQVKLFDWYVSR
jgi:hypothetical protein